MGANIRPDEKKAVADRLKREASSSRPAFSESLHARICRAVESGKSRPARRFKWPAFRWPIAAAVVAAACAAGVWLIAPYLNRTPTLEPSPVHVADSVPETPETPDPLVELRNVGLGIDRTAMVSLSVDEELTTQGWAYLDHDAHLAAGLVIDQLPFEIVSAGEP